MSISVIIPTCGRLQLEHAVTSVITQLHPEDELIVVGSRRPTIEHPQMTYLHKDNGGHNPATLCALSKEAGYPAGAQEKDMGWAAAKGTHVMLLDDDDLYLPGTLALARDAIGRGEHPLTVFIFRMMYGVKGQWVSQFALTQADGARVLWGTRPEVIICNVGGSMYVMPNDKRFVWHMSSGVVNSSDDYWGLVNYLKHADVPPPIFCPEVVSIIKPTRQQLKDLYGIETPEDYHYAPQFAIWDGKPQ